MPNNYIIKANAKTSLQNKWPKAIGIGAIALSVFCLYIVLINLISFPTSLIFEKYTNIFVLIFIIVIFLKKKVLLLRLYLL